MRKLFLFFCCILYSQLNSQTNYVFNVELNDKNNAPIFTQNGNILIYSGSNTDEAAFFSNYTITGFEQTYPASKVSTTLNYFTFKTTSSSLMNDLKSNFPSKYLVTEDLTGHNLELLYYPNDYGTTSPVSNLGANLSLKSFDYINVPKAWDYFPINQIGNIKIGISDGKVANSDLDFSNKVTFINESSFNSNFLCGSDAWHGVSVGAVAAAQGNNGHGISGICSDCEIVSTPYTLNYNGILDLAYSGVKVINMSWAYMYQNDTTYLTGYFQSQQDVINEIHDMGVVLVASAGNLNSYSAPAPNYLRYGYPASYDNVISVSGVNHKNANFIDEITHETYGDVSWYNEDLISPTGIYNNGQFSSFYEGFTTNSRVDICAPGWRYPLYGSYLLGCLQNGLPSNYGDGTSGSAPYVTGTIALMQSLNPCLSPNAIEDVLQLTSKNIEINPHNHMYFGRIGSGKLETGDAIEFTHNMMSSSGDALIDGQDFWRFNFDLQHINNKLTISNQTFRDGNTSNFIAKNTIEILQNSDFRPNSNGFVDLKIDNALTVCPPPSNRIQPDGIVNSQISKIKNAKLYPNPNNGIFLILIDQVEVKDLELTIFDIIGKPVYQTKVDQNEFEINVSNFPSGIYFVKLSSNLNNEILKFIKK